MNVAFLAMLACRKESAEPAVAAPEGGVGATQARRLSRDELDHVLFDLLGDDRGMASRLLPADVIDPFDNAVANQEPSGPLVQALEALANDVATDLVADRSRREGVVGCSPTGPTDEACLSSFVANVGRLAIHRTLTPQEVDRYVTAGMAAARDDGDFWSGVDLVVRVFLQHPEFVYRVERGEPTDEAGVFRLTGPEVATRLSFLVWTSIPDHELLDAAESGQLETGDELRAQAVRMLADDRARERVDRFHAMWLGYWSLPHAEALTRALRTETAALVDDVVFERDAPWLELFTADGTFADDALAAHYGLPLPGTDEYVRVPYGDSGRQGLLSTGSFLSVNAKFGDTSPTLRGKLVRERLLCEDIPPPPPTVNVDEPPTGDGDSVCKVDRYAVHDAPGGCHACHAKMDPVGFGLEAFDREGRFREHDEGEPGCPISGEGDLDGAPFVGPAGLADLLVEGPELSACAVEQVVRFAMGRDPDADDRALVDELAAGWAAGDGSFDDLLLALVASEPFRFRRETVVGGAP